MTIDNSKVFSVDPGWRESWWWFWLPLVLIIIIFVIMFTAPQFYRQWMHPEGYGFLELLHFFVPLSGFLLAVSMLFKPYVRQQTLLFYWLLLLTLGCFYIAGEEHSWGQHFFNWGTPDYWAGLNRQNETNLHNTLRIFNQLPETFLLLGVLIGGLILPLIDTFRPFIKDNRFALFLPARAVIPVAFLAIGLQVLDKVVKWADISIFARLSEVMETFLYLFILYYIIILIRRIKAMAGES